MCKNPPAKNQSLPGEQVMTQSPSQIPHIMDVEPRHVSLETPSEDEEQAEEQGQPKDRWVNSRVLRVNCSV
eukprot:9226486-Pyramimonas_sp.AAC.1